MMVGIKDVARASGVSAATVSQVLGGGKRPVRAATRARVLEAARALGYRPNAVARGLVKRRMDTIGVVISHAAAPARTNPTLGAILDGILAVATRRRQHTTLVTYDSWHEAAEALPSVYDGRCDGVLVVVPPNCDETVSVLIGNRLPFVLVGAHSDDPCVSCVDINNVAAAAQIVGHVLAQGHRRIAFFSDLGWGHQFVDERAAGYRQAMTVFGLVPDPSWIIALGDVERDLAALLALPQRSRPTALFCVTDLCALAVLHFLSERGVSVPEELSVVGFDDIFPAATSRPPLTTVHQPCSLAGERAAEILLGRIAGDVEAGTKVVLPTELVVRRSVVPPPV